MPELFTICVETHFHASHRLRFPDGSKESAHDHDWQVTAQVSSGRLNPMGIVMNFVKLKAMLDEIVCDFNHTALDTIDCFQQNNPSAENVAKYVYEKLQAKLPKGVRLRSIRVVEQPGCSAEYNR